MLAQIVANKMLPPQLANRGGLMLTFYQDVRSQLLAQKEDERFIPLLEHSLQNGRITNEDARSILKVSKSTATRLLQNMGQWLEQKGKVGKGTFYAPWWSREFE